jgi:large subunit ribosomal protein L25
LLLEILKLKARPRTGSGKSYTRKTRAAGWVPAIYYGSEREPMKIEVDKKELSTLVRGRNLTHLIDLGLSSAGGKEASVAVIREFQRHVFKDDVFLHVDFQHVDMDKKVIVDCPVELVGIPIGVKDNGGVLGHPIKKIKVECMPLEIPEKITVDVSALDIGDSIHVRDVKLANAVIKDSPDEVLAVVTHPTREEEVAKPEAAAVAEGTEGAAAVPGAAPGVAPAAGAAAPGAAPAAGAAAPAKDKGSKDKGPKGK